MNTKRIAAGTEPLVVDLNYCRIKSYVTSIKLNLRVCFFVLMHGQFLSRSNQIWHLACYTTRMGNSVESNSIFLLRL